MKFISTKLLLKSTHAWLLYMLAIVCSWKIETQIPSSGGGDGNNGHVGTW